MDLFLIINPLLINTLNEMNCEPVVDEKENNRVDFTYQGQNFSINIDDNSEFITLWYFEDTKMEIMKNDLESK